MAGGKVGILCGSQAGGRERGLIRIGQDGRMGRNSQETILR